VEVMHSPSSAFLAPAPSPFFVFPPNKRHVNPTLPCKDGTCESHDIARDLSNAPKDSTSSLSLCSSRSCRHSCCTCVIVVDSNLTF
jgi:hypothetical protein